MTLSILDIVGASAMRVAEISLKSAQDGLQLVTTQGCL
jgi:hypothetical protein